jgi:hypothetical protein
MTSGEQTDSSYAQYDTGGENSTVQASPTLEDPLTHGLGWEPIHLVLDPIRLYKL